MHFVDIGYKMGLIGENKIRTFREKNPKEETTDASAFPL